MNAIATAELRMLIRNRLVAVCAILIPLGLGAFFILTMRGPETIVLTSVLQLLVMLGMGVYITATTTLAARRQTLFLKRLRSGSVSDLAIIGGLVLPIVIVNLVQVAVIFVALSIAGEVMPANAWLLAVIVLFAEIMFVGFALATAGVTNSPEHAQVTTIPLFFVALGAPLFVTFVGAANLGVMPYLLPGGTVPELMALAWTGGDLTRVPLLLVPMLVWGAIALLAAKYMFRWEPRR